MTKEHQDLMEEMINLATTVRQLREKYTDDDGEWPFSEDIVSELEEIKDAIERAYNETYLDVYGQYSPGDLRSQIK